ncbi:hypothetical protein E2C01_042694 [Portunus trituberculatus]|uniref:Uncharacterized protein n=1 Tax=Portunus trituberculatus TaxID=210409 RepID=A0A5B7FVH5_PORTR|nr:hypothetical protein [Portunus trituberculatus]
MRHGTERVKPKPKRSFPVIALNFLNDPGALVNHLLCFVLRKKIY